MMNSPAVSKAEQVHSAFRVETAIAELLSVIETLIELDLSTRRPVLCWTTSRRWRRTSTVECIIEQRLGGSVNSIAGQADLV
jgi:hypothetical protein